MNADKCDVHLCAHMYEVFAWSLSIEFILLIRVGSYLALPRIRVRYSMASTYFPLYYINSYLMTTKTILLDETKIFLPV